MLLLHSFYFIMIRLPPISTLFPYTTLFRSRAAIMDAAEPGGLGGTYGGNPLACAAALAVLDVFEQDKLLDRANAISARLRSEEHTSELQSQFHLVCRLLLEKKKKKDESSVL